MYRSGASRKVQTGVMPGMGRKLRNASSSVRALCSQVALETDPELTGSETNREE